MEQNNPFNFQRQQKLPNATAVLILGIASIITCCCYGIIGLVLGAVALVLAKQDMERYKANPDLYTNYSNLNVGRVLAIIGLALNVIYIIFVIWILMYFGLNTLKDPQLMQEKIRQLTQ